MRCPGGQNVERLLSARRIQDPLGGVHFVSRGADVFLLLCLPSPEEPGWLVPTTNACPVLKNLGDLFLLLMPAQSRRTATARRLDDGSYSRFFPAAWDPGFRQARYDCQDYSSFVVAG